LTHIIHLSVSYYLLYKIPFFLHSVSLIRLSFRYYVLLVTLLVTLKLGAVSSSEKKIHFNQTTRRRTPEQNLKFYSVIADLQSNTRAIVLCTEAWIFFLLKRQWSSTQQVLTLYRLRYWILLLWTPSLQRSYMA